ncbi:MAG: MMPL family transporter [Solirubrobacterales bacterium]
MLGGISNFAAGRRSKWAIIGFWVLLAFALGQFQPKLQEATTNENEAFLPESAESTEVNDILDEDFAQGREVEALVAYTREGELSAADRQRIAADAEAVCQSDQLEDGLVVINPFGEPCVPAGAEQAGAGGGQRDDSGAPSLVSEDGTTALTVITTNSDDSEVIMDNVDFLRETVPDSDGEGTELRAYVTGTAGFIADSIEVFESIDVTLLLVTVTLVVVLLLLLYRSPVIALVPLITVGIAYTIAAAVVYGLVEAGAVEVNGQTTAILIVLMFGAGTDYCLLIVARYREGLRHHPDKHAAMAEATERTAPAILSAGATVVAAMLVLALADFKATQTMGPVLALGVAIMLLAGLTLLPALLAALGRGAFWPARPEYGSEAKAGRMNFWGRIGHLVHDRPVPALVTVVAILALGCLGNLGERESLDFGEGFKTDPDSKIGQAVIDEKLSPGQSAATNIVTGVDAEQPVLAALRRDENVEAAVATGLVSDDGALTRVDVTLTSDPFSDAAADQIPALRDTVTGAAGDATALVGGLTAENYDTARTLEDDARIIIPLILLLIFVILMVLLRAVVAPLYLIASVVLSFGFALGVSTLAFEHIFGQDAGDPGLPTFAFIFLVALGVDYNIFLISRIREEHETKATKEAVITGLERTGSVITSAGLILAATFLALAALPLESLFQLGFTVAFGLLVDTFVVRSILVPSAAFLLGERNWWPSRGVAGRAAPPG